ncbi:MAG: AmmeMemoRadiSam system protein A, partial [Kiritimatiellia bacterium]
RETLFALARDTLGWCVQREAGEFSFEQYCLTDKLRQPAATFVTLKIDGELRGCIGSLMPEDPLYLSVHRNAVNAARHDPRFSPVTEAELASLTVDISILSPIEPLADPADFKLGQQGIILERGRQRAVFLPEVALEQNWTREQTLSFLSRKAGLSPDAWRQGATFKVFESVVLSAD